jgi:hypothetical protein
MQARKITPRFAPAPDQARRITPPGPARRARLGLDAPDQRKSFDTTGEVGRHDPSRPPPAHEPGYSEHRVAPTIRTSTTRALRLWSKTEVK